MQAVNLVLVIGHLIEEQKPDLANLWWTSVPKCDDQPLHQQVLVINRYWREQLGMLTVDTANIRGLLCDTTEPKYWFENFKQYVIPFIIANNLPDKKLFHN